MKSEKARFLSPDEALAQARQRTPAERFYMLMRLIKIQRMLANARQVK
jgi:hypothetical protein